MNIHLPAILMFTRGTIGFDTLPYGSCMFLLHLSPLFWYSGDGKHVCLSVQVGWGELVDTADTKIGRGDVLLVVDMQHFDCSISHGQLG
jgi:hypothetical protein